MKSNLQRLSHSFAVFLEAMGPATVNQQAAPTQQFVADQQFVPIGRDTVQQQQFGGQSFLQQQPFRSFQADNEGGVMMMQPPFTRTSFMSPMMMGGPYDAMGMPMGVQPFGWGNEVGNLVGGILDGVRNLVGTTISGGSGWFMWYRK
ncbi:hypothetical protein Aduo_016900 [Ancylostoma duodenale]